MSTVPNSLSAPLLTSTHTPAMPHDDVLENNISPVQKEDKLPHDASVFVGSLPSSIDQGDLSRMLMDHLSEHTQIKNIKVVRDSKGGVCAFVQCENATSATDLIQTLHSKPPNLFMGRILRYEPARAFRTLLVSYRGPTQIVPLSSNNSSNTSALCLATESTEVPLDLPHAMRIWKHRNSRFHSITYNSDAIQTEETNSAAGLSSENAIFLHALKFDEETLRRLTSYFGPLEKFSVLESPTSVDCDYDSMHQASSDGKGQSDADHGSQYPSPHDAPRSPSMDLKCWEVKWEHRDDCVSALMTLKRVPHLTVTWAHQPSPVNNNFSPYSIPSSTSFPFHSKRQISSRQLLTSGHTQQHPPLQRKGLLSAACAFVSQQKSPSKPEKADYDTQEPIHDWSKETDTSGQTLSSVAPGDASWDSTDCKSSWGNDELSPVIESIKRGAEENASSTQPKVANDSIELSENGVQEVYMPQTPDLDATTISPLTPGTQFPITPTSDMGDTTNHVVGEHGLSKDLGLSYNLSRPEREIDPTTLFVGGLEMFGPSAWDEKKVENFFSKFGGLESVKVVRPVNSCTAFAFVKFNNADAPARAVSEEHNRVHEGRAMRVQLRDCNPPRNNWKVGRGRGRYHQNDFGSQRRLYNKPFNLRGQTPHRCQNDSFTPDVAGEKDGPDIQIASLVAGLPSVSGVQSPGASGLAPVNSYNPSVTSIPTAKSNSPPIEKYREWYDEPKFVTHTPEPSSLGSSVSTAGIQFSGTTYAYPLPQGPFFPPQPWGQPYMPQTPYQPQQMSYYPGYPIYPPASIQSTQVPGVPSPPNSDAGTSTIGIQGPWPHVGVYAPYIPYPAIHPRPGMGELSRPPVATQAPLIPTGFIQNEQGTLIPVYQPEALDRYMASSGITSPPIPVSHPSHPPTGPHRGATSPYPYNVSNPPAGNAAHSTPSQVANRPILHSSLQAFPSFSASPTAPRGGVDFFLNSPSPLYRRPGQRRENAQQNQSNAVRHYNHPRAHNGRSQRGHMHISAVPDLGHSGILPAMKSGQWPRWNGAR